MSFPDPLPFAVQNTKCFHCGNKVWKYLKREKNGKLYECMTKHPRCGNVLFLDDKFDE